MDIELKPSKEKFENTMRPFLPAIRLTKSSYGDSYVIEDDNRLWKAYQAGFAEAQRWIPVSEHLPAGANSYWVTDGANSAEAYWDFKSEPVYENQKLIKWVNVPAFIATDSHVSTYSGAGEAELNFTPTHWMPLPAAPQEISHEHAI